MIYRNLEKEEIVGLPCMSANALSAGLACWMALARSTSNISRELVGPVLFVFVDPGVPPPGDIWDPALLPKGGPKGAGGGVSDEDGGPNLAPTVPMFFSILKRGIE